METFFLIYIVFGIPAIFLILCIKNIVGIVKSKKENVTVKKSLIIKSIIFGIIFILIIIFYNWVMYLLSRAVASM